MPEKKIIVVGGGSAGWMSAAYLSRVFARGGSGYRIVLVESHEVPSIGVGEATIQDMRQFLGALGISEGAFLTGCDATLKHGILFKDWTASSPATDQFFHAFEYSPAMAPEDMVNHWLNAKLKRATDDGWGRWSGIQCAAAANMRSPKALVDDDYEASLPYGYHLDANKFAHFLKAYCLARGVEHVIATLEGVETDEKNAIAAVTTADGQRFDGDFFIDCTGFAALLMNAIGAEYIPYKDRLLVDSAVTARLPVVGGETPLRPFTTATARSSGWTFEIDLPKRKGVGYSYSADHQSKEDAETEFRSLYDDLHDEISVNHFDLKVGRLKDSWIGNCVAIGLSAGFIEPLESTGLHFVTSSLRYLVSYLDPDFPEFAGHSWYNDFVARTFDDATNFVQLHYLLSSRRDTLFWREMTEGTRVSDTLAARLELWKYKAPSASDFVGEPIFGAPSYSAILYGMGKLPDAVPAITRKIDPSESLSVHARLEALQRQAVQGLPSHADFLKKTAGVFA